MNAAARTPGVDAMGAWGGGDGEWSWDVAEGIVVCCCVPVNELRWMSCGG